MKRWFVVATFVFLAVLVTIFMIPSFIDLNSYKGQIIAGIQEKTGYEVVLDGDLDFGILPVPHASLRGIGVSNPSQNAIQTEPILTAELVTVSLELVPLLQGDFSVSSVRLEKPVIFISKSKNGVFSYVMPMDEGGQSPQSNANNASAAGAGPNISIDNFEIENAQITYKDLGSDAAYTFEAVNAEARIESLSGPLEAQGQFAFNKKTYTFEIDADAFRSLENGSDIPLNIRLSSPSDKAEISFRGVVGLGESLTAQGQIEGKADSLGQFGMPNYPVELTGVATYQGDSATIQELTVNYGPVSAGGSIKAELQDASKITAQLKTKSKGLPGGGALAVNADYALANGALGYNAEFQNLDVLAVAKFANIDIEGSKDFLRKAGPLNGRIKGELADGAIRIDPSQIAFGQSQLNIAGSYAPQKNARANAVIDITASKLDATPFMKASGKEPAVSVSKSTNGSEDMGKTIAQTTAGLSNIPVNLDFDVSVEELVLPEDTFKNIRLMGRLANNSLSLENAFIEDFYNARLSLNGGIADLEKLSGIAITAGVQTQNPQNLLARAGLEDTQALAKLGSLDLAASLNGDPDRLDWTVNLNALKGKVEASGILNSVLTAPQIGDLKIRAQNPNFANLAKAFNPGFQASPALSKPLDVYTEIIQDDQRYSLKDFTATIGDMAYTGSIIINTAGDKPAITGGIKAGDIPLDAFVSGGASKSASQSSASAAGNPPAGKKERWSTASLDSAWLDAKTIELDITAKSISYGPWSVQDAALVVALNNGVMEVSRMDGKLFGGTLSSNATVKGGADQKGYDIIQKAELRGVDIGQLSNALSGGARLVQASGTVSLDTNLQGRGQSVKSLVSSLSGKADLAGESVVMQGFDLAKLSRALVSTTKVFDNVSGVYGALKAGGQSRFDTISGSFPITNGVITMQDFVMTGPEATITNRGNVNLPLWTIDMTSQIDLVEPEDAPVLEMKFSGPLDNPRDTFASNAFESYVNKRIQNKVQDLISEKLFGNKSGAQDTEPAAGPDDGSDTSPENENKAQQNQQTDPAEEAVRGLIRGLLQ